MMVFFLKLWEDVPVQRVKRVHLQGRHDVVKHFSWTSRVIFYILWRRGRIVRDLLLEKYLGVSFAFSLTLIVFLIAMSKVVIDPALVLHIHRLSL